MPKPKSAPKEEMSNAEKIFLMEKGAGSWGQYATFADYQRAKSTGTIRQHQTSKGYERSLELTPERIEEIFLTYAGNPDTLNPTECWIWGGSSGNPALSHVKPQPYFGQGQYAESHSTSARQYAWEHWIGSTPVETLASMRTKMDPGCNLLCVNPYHMRKGPRHG